MDHTRVASILSAVLSSVLFGGCAGVAGVWQGSMDCGTEEEIGIGFEVARDGAAHHTGEGWISGVDYATGLMSIDFQIEIEMTREAGAQELEVDIDHCVYDVQGFSSWEDDCGDNPRDVQWDGRDVMVGEVHDFLGAGRACDIEVERLD